MFVFQLSVLIYDLLVTEVWKQKVFPEILDADFEPKTTFPLYMTVSILLCTVKPVLSSRSKEDRNLFFKTDYPLIHVKSIAESKEHSAVQYVPPALICHLSLRNFFVY